MCKNIFSKLKLPIYWSFFAIMLDTVSFGLIMPVMPDLLLGLGCQSISDAALYSGILSAVFALMQFVFSPLIGNLSDRFGRRPILLVSLAVACLDYVIKGFAHSMWVLFAGRIISGITLANYSTATAAIADVSNPQDKAANFGLLGTALGLGFIFGAVIGALLSSLGLRAPFYAAAILSCANMIFVFLFVGETVNPKNKRPFMWLRANPLGAFKSVSTIPGLARMMLVIFFYEITFVVYAATWAYFTKERLGWDASTVGVSLGFFGVMAALMQGCAIRLFLSCMGELKTAVFALSVNVLAFLLYSFASQSWMIFALIPLSALGTIFLPAIQSLISSLVRDDSQGELQGVVSSIRGVSIIIGPPLMTSIFSFFTSDNAALYFPGAPFLMAMVLSVVSLAIFCGASQIKK